MVCFFHFTKGYVDEASAMRFIWAYGWSGVEIFFVISGFVIPYSLLGSKFKIANYWKFLKKRLVRIEPAYLLSIAIILLLNYVSTLFAMYQGHAFDVSLFRLVLHIGYLVDIFGNEWFNPVYWTLAVELQYYLLIGVLIAVWNLKNSYLTILTVVLFLMMSFLHLKDIRMLQYTDVFTIGIIAAFYKIHWMSRPQFLIATALVAIVIFINHNIVICLVTLLCTLIIAFFDTLSDNRFLLLLGNISYSLYLLHIPIGGRIINLAKRFELDEFSKSLVVILAVVVSIFVSWLFYLAVEKPSHKLSKRVRLKVS